jgi:hypothetical protein
LISASYSSTNRSFTGITLSDRTISCNKG